MTVPADGPGSNEPRPTEQATCFCSARIRYHQHLYHVSPEPGRFCAAKAFRTEPLVKARFTHAQCQIAVTALCLSAQVFAKWREQGEHAGASVVPTPMQQEQPLQVSEPR